MTSHVPLTPTLRPAPAITGLLSKAVQYTEDQELTTAGTAAFSEGHGYDRYQEERAQANDQQSLSRQQLLLPA